jgi:hypothetical protein
MKGNEYNTMPMICVRGVIFMIGDRYFLTLLSGLLPKQSGKMSAPERTPLGSLTGSLIPQRQNPPDRY